jgi:integrase
MKKNNETLEFTTDPIINSKIKAIVAGLPKSISKLFLEFSTDHIKELVADFLDSCVKQENISLNTKRTYLVALAYFAREVKDKKLLELVSSSDLKTYLDSMQKSTAEDPDESWINTQRTLGLPILKFFKWLAYPQLTPQERKLLPKEQYPEVLRRFVLQRKKGSKTPVKTSDKWKLEDVAIFLKYCTDNPRLRFYHALAWETSGRPGELLILKISDIDPDNFMTDENGKLCAIFEIGRYGKTKLARNVGITEFTIQYYRKYLVSQHPDPNNKEAYLFLSQEYSALGRNLPISVEVLRKEYLAFRDKVILKLLKRPDVPEEDKKHLQFLKDTKKWSVLTAHSVNRSTPRITALQFMPKTCSSNKLRLCGQRSREYKEDV